MFLNNCRRDEENGKDIFLESSVHLIYSPSSRSQTLVLLVCPYTRFFGAWECMGWGKANKSIDRQKKSKPVPCDVIAHGDITLQLAHCFGVCRGRCEVGGEGGDGGFGKRGTFFPATRHLLSPKSSNGKAN